MITKQTSVPILKTSSKTYDEHVSSNIHFFFLLQKVTIKKTNLHTSLRHDV